MLMNLKNLFLGATLASFAAIATPALASPPPPAATEIAFSIAGTGSYDPTGALSLAALESFAGNGAYYLTVTGTFAVTFNPPTDSTTLLDGPVSISLGNGIDAPVEGTAMLSDMLGSPIAYGDLQSAVQSLLSANPDIAALIDSLASNPTGSVVYNSVDYADYTYSYTGDLASGITGSFSIGSPYALDMGTDPGTLNFAVAVDLAPVPEPISAALFGAGLLGLGIIRRRRA